MKITYKGKEIEDICDNTKVIELLKRENDIEKSNIACMVNNQVRNLNYEINNGDKIDIIDLRTRDGIRIYVRGLLYIMSKALSKIYPQALISIDYQLADSMFCKIDNMEVTDEIIENVKSEMKSIIEKDLEIKKVVMTKKQAEEFYEKDKTLKGRLQLDNNLKDTVSLYFCEDYFNYFYGVMPISTGYINVFDIKKYNDGFLVLYPNKSNPDKLGTYRRGKKFLSTLEEYEQIHRILKVNTIYNLNRKIREGKKEDLVLLSEALQEKKIADIADDIVNKKKIKMVLIAGPSSSGKTTFAKRLGLQLRLNGIKPVTISTDNYFVERKDTPKDENGQYDFETIDSLDLKLFNDHLKRLLNGQTVQMPTFDFSVGTKKYTGKTLHLAEDEVLVIEGIHCLNDKLTSEISKENKYKIYISDLTVLNIDYYNRISTTDTRLIRRIVRDNQFRNYSALQTLKMWDSVNKGENKNIFPYQEEADIMFNSSLVYELAVLKKYAQPLLKEIKPSDKEYSEAIRLYELLNYFDTIEDDIIPRNSILREFIGESIFDYE